MESKSILLVTAAFYPENSPRSFRATELAKEFVRQGHKVVVYVPFQGFDYKKWGNENNIIFNDLGKLRLKGILIEGSNSVQLIKRVLKRGMLLLFQYPNIELMFKVRNKLINEKGYDLLISNAFPHPIHWGVAWARKMKNPIAKTWVADCGDPFMGNKMDSFKKLFYFKYFEKWFGKKCDYISVPAADYIQYYYKEFNKKIRVIPQGFKFEDSRIYEGVIKNKEVTFAFAGRFLPKLRDPRPLLDHLLTIEQPFRFVVFSPNTEFLYPYKNKLGAKLDIRGFIPREDLLFELSQMDFLIHVEFHSSVKSDSPSKFADYAIVKKPVIALNMDHFDTEKLSAFINKDYRRQIDLTDADKFRIENVTRQFLDLINR